MKKVIVFLLIVFMASSVFAVAPVNHTATILPNKAIKVSGGTSGSFTTLHAEFSYGFNFATIHGKVNLHNRGFNFESMMQHHLLDVAEIDMGFSYGLHVLFSNLGRLEAAIVGQWNMSYDLASNVAFYGGLKFKAGFGATTWSNYNPLRLNGFVGTEIGLIENLDLYLELQPIIFADVNMLGGGSAFLGVNYYFGKKAPAVEIPDA